MFSKLVEHEKRIALQFTANFIVKVEFSWENSGLVTWIKEKTVS